MSFRGSSGNNLLMRTTPAFDLFEEICEELSDKDETVLADDDFSPSVLEALRRWAKETVNQAALAKGLKYLHSHFEARGSVLPFSYDLQTGRVAVVNRAYVDFVFLAQEQRSSRKESKDFETATSKHLALRLTGIVRRVGSPRNRHKSRKNFAAYLVKEFNFKDNVLVGHDKDGGLDILWFPPLGAFPLRAMVSIQCKNSLYDRDDGFKSVGRAKQTLRRHSHATAEESHLHCVVYNDYIDEKVVEHARDAEFVPLGLSDLAPLTDPVTIDQL
jgi:hypothetical protein